MKQVGQARQLKRAGLPYVVSPHGMLEPWAFRHRGWKKRPFFSLLGKPMLEAAEAVMVTSQMEADNVQRLMRPKQIEVLPLGCRDPQTVDYAEARRKLDWKDGERVLVFLSRIDEKKGLDLLLHGLGKAQVEGVRLVVVGGGEAGYVESLKALGSELNLAVDWVGPVWGEGRWPYLQGADGFCLTTHSENFGIAVLEALHVGTPVLTTEGTPWKEYRDRDGVWICEAEVGSISSVLRNLLADADAWDGTRREALSNWAEEGFAWPALAGRYKNFYEGILESSGR